VSEQSHLDVFAMPPAIIDPVSGAYTRDLLDAQLGRELARARRTDAAFSLCLLDIDHFKSINDTRGHPEGDRVLQDVARIAQGQLRAGEQIFRIGGEEFAIVIPGDGATGVKVAERVRTAVQNEPRVPRLPTLSAGVAVFPQDAETRETLFQAADLALYAAKQGGRNAVSLAA
jgi:two-component system cell cycle response regulator